MIIAKFFLLLSVLCLIVPDSYTHLHMGLNEVDSVLDNTIDNSEEEKVENRVETKIYHSLDLKQNNSDSPTNSNSDPKPEEERILSLSFIAFGDTVFVNLERVPSQVSSSNTPVFIARGSHDDSYSATFEKADNHTLGRAVACYQDRKSNSFISVFRDDDFEPFFTGFIHSFFIQHIPNSERKRKREASQPSIDGLTASDYHLVSRIDKKKREAPVQYYNRESRFKRQVESLNSSVIYPQILVVTNYNLSVSSTSSPEFYDHLIYILAFFNGIDMFFQQLTNPEVRLHISGIVINADRAAAPYINNNRNSIGAIDAVSAIKEMGEFYAKNLTHLSPQSYDIIVHLIDDYICDEHEAVHCSPILAGVSSIDKVCSDNDPAVSMLAIVQDNLAFSGLLSATHELGHIMGAEHDGEEEAVDCPFADGYIMSKYNSSSPVSLTWSNCSEKYFTEKLSSEEFHCLHHSQNHGADGNVLDPILPGDVKGLNDQCQALGYVRACLGPQNCLALTCSKSIYPFSNDCVKVGIPAAQASYCAFSWRCIDGLCLPDLLL